MRFLDLFCGAGGAAMGMHRAYPEAEIIGVDNRPQPHYPFTFVLADALNPPFDLRGFDLIWASPPCQRYSVMTKCRPGIANKYPDLVASVREMLWRSDKPYVIENVPGAPLKFASVLLCGTMFGLETSTGNQLRRHRLFETNPTIGLTPPCQHNDRKATVGVWGHTGGHSLGGNRTYFHVDSRREVMDINWMVNEELCQAIPPAYSEYILRQMRLEAAP